MALSRDFEILNSGATIANAYHIIVDVQLQKRLVPTAAVNQANDPLGSGTGYIGVIYMAVYGSKQAREEGKNPVAMLNDALPEKPCQFKFVFNAASSDSILTQAYNFLKTTDYYKDSTEV